MEEQKKNDQEGTDEKKAENEEEALPFCTTAPSAEHARGDLDEEPCDDSRGGE